MRQLIRAGALVGVLAFTACKEPVEDRVGAPPPPPPPPSVKAVPRGQPPPEAKAYVLKQTPPLRTKSNAVFEGQMALVGYDVPKTKFRPGEAVPVTLYWKALADVTENWQMFMHLDPEGVDDPGIRGYGDHWPVFGLYPTVSWKAGDIIRDQVTVTLHPNTRKPRAELWVGMYQGDRRAKLVGAPNDGRNRYKVAVFDVDGAGAAAVGGGKSYRVYRAKDKPVIDGKLDEPAWQKVASTGRFTRTTGGPAKSDTFAKLLWDDENLYIGFYCSDSDIRSPYTKRDEPLWQADAVEVFLDPSGKGENYVELQVSPANVVFDAFFPKRLPPPNRGGDFGHTVNMKTAVVVNGTLNQAGDVDKSWTVEMAIPLKEIKFAPNTPPKEGDMWRINLIRTERTAGFDDSAWSPPGNDYHNLEQMGRIHFAGEPGVGKRGAGEPGVGKRGTGELGKVPMDPNLGIKLKAPKPIKALPELRQKLQLLRRKLPGDGGMPTVLPAP